MSLPAIWAIGDVQGCDESLGRLLAHPLLTQDLTRADTRLWFAGDLVNRGPASAQVLRRIRGLGQQAVTVLGNHDLHLLGVAAGVRGFKPLDTLQDLLKADDAAAQIDWLRCQPLAYQQDNYLLVHAGLWPYWSAAQALGHAHEISNVLQAPDWQTRIGHLFGPQPTVWDDCLEGAVRQRVIVSTLTRLRYCDAQGRMALEYDMAPADAPAALMPWFEHPAFHQRRDGLCVVFGHWSRLGLHLSESCLGLDTGCVWGGPLTAVRLGDRQVVQVPRDMPI